MSCIRLSYLNTNTHTNVPYMVRSPLRVYAAATRPTQQRQSPRLDLRLQLLIHDCYSPPLLIRVLSSGTPYPTFNYSPPHIFRRWRSILDVRVLQTLYTFCPRFRSTAANSLTSASIVYCTRTHIYPHTHTHYRCIFITL